MSLNDRERVGAFWLLAVADARSNRHRLSAFLLLAVKILSDPVSGL
jgi:hypothetical protein